MCVYFLLAGKYFSEFKFYYSLVIAHCCIKQSSLFFIKHLINMNYAWTAPIEKLMIWRTNKWMKYESKCERFVIRINYDQLLIMSSDSKVLESLSLNSKVKGIYKENLLILFISLSGKEIRKIKFQIQADVAQCLKKLAEHFPVTSYSGSKTSISLKYRNIDEVLQTAITQLKNSHDETSDILPSDYRNFISLCLLDPAFPQIVKETEKTLKHLSK